MNHLLHAIRSACIGLSAFILMPFRLASDLFRRRRESQDFCGFRPFLSACAAFALALTVSLTPDAVGDAISSQALLPPMPFEAVGLLNGSDLSSFANSPTEQAAAIQSRSRIYLEL